MTKLLSSADLVIRTLGYLGIPPVYSLDVASYRITEMRTVGENPGCIFRHDANLGADGIIRISGGQNILIEGGKQKFKRSIEVFALDPGSWTWRRTTNRTGFRSRFARKTGALHPRAKPQVLLPSSVEYTISPCEEWNRARIVVDGISVSLKVGVSAIELIVEGKPAR